MNPPIADSGNGSEPTGGESEWTQPLARTQSLSASAPLPPKRNKPKRKKDKDRMEDTSSGRPESQQPRVCFDSPNTPVTLCSRTSTGTDTTLEMTPVPSANNSDGSLQAQSERSDQLEDDSKRRKKKKSKKKKEKRRSSKTKTDGSTPAEDEVPLTVRDEKLVEELCSFLTDTLSTSQNKESFLRMLKEENASLAGHTFSSSRRSSEAGSRAASAAVAAYSSLSSPSSSVCASLASHKSTLSQLYSKSTNGNWTNVDPPSVAHLSPKHLSNSNCNSALVLLN